MRGRWSCGAASPVRPRLTMRPRARSSRHPSSTPGSGTTSRSWSSRTDVTDEDLKFAVVALSAVFFVIDPLANLPIFLTITAGDSAAQRRRTALRAAFAAWIVLGAFAVAGGVIFKAFGISLGAFKIAGGIMLLLMAIDMMRAQTSRTRTTEEEQTESQARDDIAIFPLAIPMLAGPGAIAMVMVLMSRAAWRPIATASVFLAVTI